MGMTEYLTITQILWLAVLAVAVWRPRVPLRDSEVRGSADEPVGEDLEEGTRVV